MPVHVPLKMQLVSSVKETFGTMEAGYFLAHFVTTFYAKTINLNIRYIGYYIYLLTSITNKEMRSINFPFPYEDGSRAVMGVKCQVKYCRIRPSFYNLQEENNLNKWLDQKLYF